MKIRFLEVFKTFLAYIIICIATFLMSRTLLEYTSLQDNVGFLKEKQDYSHIMYWKVAFYIHVFSSIFCLVAGFTQFSNQLLIDYPRIHRFIGRMYVFNILVINFPAAFIMAYYANGFIPTKVAFFILDFLWFWFTSKALLEIRKGNVLKHKYFMIRSYALTFSAITLRTWKLILSNSIEIDPITLYMIDAWLGFVPNLLIAELIIWQAKKKAAFTL